MPVNNGAFTNISLRKFKRKKYQSTSKPPRNQHARVKNCSYVFPRPRSIAVNPRTHTQAHAAHRNLEYEPNSRALWTKKKPRGSSLFFPPCRPCPPKYHLMALCELARLAILLYLPKCTTHTNGSLLSRTMFINSPRREPKRA